MNKPSETIDGAKVLCWAWSGVTAFGVVASDDAMVVTEIFGLAICKYDGAAKVYRFSCGADWTVEQDFEYETILDAKRDLPLQYQNVPIAWIDFV